MLCFAGGRLVCWLTDGHTTCRSTIFIHMASDAARTTLLPDASSIGPELWGQIASLLPDFSDVKRSSTSSKSTQAGADLAVKTLQSSVSSSHDEQSIVLPEKTWSRFSGATGAVIILPEKYNKPEEMRKVLEGFPPRARRLILDVEFSESPLDKYLDGPLIERALLNSQLTQHLESFATRKYLPPASANNILQGLPSIKALDLKLMDDDPILWRRFVEYKPFKLFCPNTLTHLKLTAENYGRRQRIDMQALGSCSTCRACTSTPTTTPTGRHSSTCTSSARSPPSSTSPSPWRRRRRRWRIGTSVCSWVSCRAWHS